MHKWKSNAYIGHNLTFQYKDAGIEKIDNEIRRAFSFPVLEDEKNIEFHHFTLHCYHRDGTKPEIVYRD